MKQKLPRLEYFVGKDTLWYARLVAANGETLSHSEGLSSKAKAIHNLKAQAYAVVVAIFFGEELPAIPFSSWVKSIEWTKVLVFVPTKAPEPTRRKKL